MSKSIHIVALDVPFPLDYGGAIDMFFRIKALHTLGYKITLHCFEYGRGEQMELEKYTDNVFYYSRKKRMIDWLSSTPFIVKSRADNSLLKNLTLDKSPILFEGIHTTAFLNDSLLSERVKLVRCHNIEHDYYKALAKRASGVKSIFYKSEAKKLAKYETVLNEATALLVIQNNDLAHFEQINPNTYLLPASLPEIEIKADVELKDYVLFHGNLSVSENEEAATWLIHNVCSKMKEIDFVIAGKSPSQKLVSLCKQNNINVIPTPSAKQMEKLITEARVHLLYTTQPTGLKLKLLNALISQGIAIVNSNMIDGTDLGVHCRIANSPESYMLHIKECFENQVDSTENLTRRKSIEKAYNTVQNCKLIETLCNELTI